MGPAVNVDLCVYVSHSGCGLLGPAVNVDFVSCPMSPGLVDPVSASVAVHFWVLAM